MSLIVVLDNIRSALNVGAIFRTCDGAGVEELVLCGITPTAEHIKIEKTALGAEGYVKWSRHSNTVDAVNELKQKGYTVYAVEQAANSLEYHVINYPEKTAVVFGHEITGVHPDVLKAVDGIIELPMKGKKNSLNVATTVGITVYHIQFTANRK